MTKPLRTALIGAGRVGAGYATDELMRRHFRYSTHGQVLAEHPSFEWVAAVDPSPAARERLQSMWDVPVVTGSINDAVACEPEVAVLAIAPDDRMRVIERMPGLRAVLVEKPLGRTAAEAASFLSGCHERSILVQVNLWRRADELFRSFAAGGLQELVGHPQAFTALYGNGLHNNGTHLIDFVRMLGGEFESVVAYASSPSPMAGDIDVAFGGRLASGATVSCQPLDFGHYREVGVDIWGTDGRVSIMQEGLAIQAFERVPNRAEEGQLEVASDVPEWLPSTVGWAFFHMYSNLADGIEGREKLWSTGESALRTTRIVEAILESVQFGGAADLR